jgi:multicomponent K+:H+ antiporter subunit A
MGTVLILAALATPLLHRNRVVALILTGVVGLMIAPLFARFSAPDLALTQVTVEVVTILLMLLALAFLPPETPRESTGPAACATDPRRDRWALPPGRWPSRC